MSRSVPLQPVTSRATIKERLRTKSKMPSQRRMRLYRRASGESEGEGTIAAVDAICLTNYRIAANQLRDPEVQWRSLSSAFLQLLLPLTNASAEMSISLTNSGDAASV